jgi:hypothetical protein
VLRFRSAGPRSGGAAGRAELDPAGEADGRQQAPALVADRPGDLDALGPEGGHGGGDVVAQQIQLGPAAFLGGVDGELGRRQREDQPAAARVDQPGPEDLGQGRLGRVGVVAVEDGVGPLIMGASSTVAGSVVKASDSRPTPVLARETG